MAQARIFHCDLCKTPCEGYDPRFGHRQTKRYYGISIDHAFSPCLPKELAKKFGKREGFFSFVTGWGHANKFTRFSAEVCEECFTPLAERCLELEVFLKEMKSRLSNRLK